MRIQHDRAAHGIVIMQSSSGTSDSFTPVEPAGDAMTMEAAAAAGGIGMDDGGTCAVATPDTGVGGGALGRSGRLLRGLRGIRHDMRSALQHCSEL